MARSTGPAAPPTRRKFRPFAEALQDLMEPRLEPGSLTVTPLLLSQILHVSESTVRRWIHGSTPTTRTFLKIRARLESSRLSQRQKADLISACAEQIDWGDEPLMMQRTIRSLETVVVPTPTPPAPIGPGPSLQETEAGFDLKPRAPPDIERTVPANSRFTGASRRMQNACNPPFFRSTTRTRRWPRNFRTTACSWAPILPAWTWPVFGR